METKVMQLAAFTLQPTITISKIDYSINDAEVTPVDANFIDESHPLHLFEGMVKIYSVSI